MYDGSEFGLYSPVAYRKARLFLARLKECARRLPYQQVMLLRDQALRGDIEGAEQELKRLLRGEDDA